MFLACQLQTKNIIQSFKLVKPSEHSAEIKCTKCDAKIKFSLKSNEDDMFKLSNESKLNHDMKMHPEALK